MSELHDFGLPCEVCASEVTLRAADSHPWVNAWLDGKITVRCVFHLARSESTSAP